MFTILLYAFIAVTSIQLIYMTFVFSKFSFTKNKSQDKQIPISVLICAKNEADNLRKNLPHIYKQNHSDFEVVLINDASHDESFEVMEFFKDELNYFFVINVIIFID